ncbi:hypothetical protein KS4_31080 [Poriferisphaera corsica]|uniref:Uncharacterized protein n=1 Tax=Poriferisphaera corsica TaxID=2528020 RepID=A0A517YXT7_9BACT|nr:hypothetical protein KS4_31080 [Poriferisphaera corsica]
MSSIRLKAYVLPVLIAFAMVLTIIRPAFPAITTCMTRAASMPASCSMAAMSPTPLTRACTACPLTSTTSPTSGSDKPVDHDAPASPSNPCCCISLIATITTLPPLEFSHAEQTYTIDIQKQFPTRTQKPTTPPPESTLFI